MHDPPCSSVEAFQHSKCHARQAVFSFKLKISNPVRVDIWFREFDDIVFDLRLKGLMTESQPTLDLIQSHFSELAVRGVGAAAIAAECSGRPWSRGKVEALSTLVPHRFDLHVSWERRETANV